MPASSSPRNRPGVFRRLGIRVAALLRWISRGQERAPVCRT